MGGSQKTLMSIWALMIVGYLVWATFALLVLDGWMRRLVGAAIGGDLAADRAFDRFFWVASGGGGKQVVATLCQLVFIAVAAFAPTVVYLRVLAGMKLLPDDIGTQIFILGIPVYMAWLVFYLTAVDPTVRRLLGAALDVTIRRSIWVSTFNWDVAAEVATGKRVTVRLADFVCTAVGYLLPVAVGVVRLIQVLRKPG